MTIRVSEPDEIAKDNLVYDQPESQRAAVLEVRRHLNAKRAAFYRCHWSAPGHGMATRASVCRSTFA